MREVARISYTASDGVDIPAYLANPETGSPRPVVVVLRGVAGGDEGYTEIAARLASWGYVALVHGWQCRGSNPTDAEIESDLDAALAFLRGVPAADTEGICFAGFCKGGIYAFMGSAKYETVRAVVVFHGFAFRTLDETHRLQPIDLAGIIKVPVLLLHGTEDKSAPLDGMRELGAKLRRSSAATSLHEYAGAQHGFAVSTHPNYSVQHAKEAFKIAQDFLSTHLAEQS